MYTASGSKDGQGARLKGRARLPETKPHTGRQTSTRKQQLDALLEYAVMHGDEAEAARLRAELAKLVEKV